MASTFDPGANDTPGAQDPNALAAQDISPEQAAQGVALGATIAMGAGHDWNDISDAANAAGADVQRPSIGDLWYGPPTGREYYGAVRDQANEAISEGAGPVGEALIGLATGSVVGAIRGAIGTGVLSDVAGAQANPIRALVQTSTEELTPRMAPIDLAVMRGFATANRIAGNRILRYGLAAEAARTTLFGGGKQQ